MNDDASSLDGYTEGAGKLSLYLIVLGDKGYEQRFRQLGTSAALKAREVKLFFQSVKGAMPKLELYGIDRNLAWSCEYGQYSFKKLLKEIDSVYREANAKTT